MSNIIYMAKISNRFPPLALRKLAITHSAEYGSVLKIGGQNWVQLTDSSEPNYMSWALAYFRYSSVLLICQLDSSYLVIAWDQQEAVCNQRVNYEELPKLVACIKNIEGYDPKVFYFIYDQAFLTSLKNEWPDAEQLTDWPDLLKTIPELKLIRSQFKQPLSWGLVSAVCFVLVFLLWPNEPQLEHAPIAPEAPRANLITLLAETPGAVAPLLELDAQFQALLFQLPGWQVAAMEYKQGVLRYRLLRTTGHLSELRRFSERFHTQLLVQGNDVWLQRNVTLPPALTQLSESTQLQPLIHLEDHLNDSIRTLLPGGEPEFQVLNVNDTWGIRRAQVRFEGYFQEDLLTLSGLIDGLPIRLIDVNYRVRDHQLYGYLSIDIYGEHNG
ncbi:hypothetical protein CWE08_05970 [Aliidiomarina iranensis]|uniref:Uncharacterized protein n=1 Tax=Aliidiomarina iranensis TaxID=1434071 RepID=A0A432VWV2_9GAMM|nr:hypothetical protein [Aliidiomarina iranensis]RUO21137.1 hypothetical protein CWE08_05970 [Aliidiomarina iranensis]